MGCGGSKPVATPSTKLTLFDPSSSDATEVKPANIEPSRQTATEPAVPLTFFLDNVFTSLDTNGNGSISKEELSNKLEFVLESSESASKKSVRQLIAESGLNPFFHIFEDLDSNQDGAISRDEFQARLHPSHAATVVECMLFDNFKKLDVNGDGNVNRKDLGCVLEQVLNSSDLVTMKPMKALLSDAGLCPDIQLFDMSHVENANITWPEFRKKLQPPNNTKELLQSFFARLDANGDGHVSKEELSATLGGLLDCSDLMSKKSFRALVVEAGMNPDFYVFDQLDTNQDGRITWEEFEAHLLPTKSEDPVVTRPQEPKPIQFFRSAVDDEDTRWQEPETDVEKSTPAIDDEDTMVSSARKICC
jgi:Ca2+-binding EF-hand superfamily protein